MRQVIIALAVLLALGAPPAHAQFRLSPRGIFGLITRPLRGVLGHLGHRHHHRRERPAQETKPADKAQSASQKEAKADATAAQANAPSDPANISVFESVLGYAIWPKAYAHDFDRYGYGDIAAAITGPAQDAHAAGFPICSGADARAGEWLKGRMEPALRQADSPRDKFEALRKNVADGAKAIKESCQTVSLQSPPERLAALIRGLWAVRDAGVAARTSLAAFYADMGEDQKVKFVKALSSDGKAAGAAHRPPEHGNLACDVQKADLTGKMLKRIEDAVHPTRDQKASLHELRNMSAQMEKLLGASCAEPVSNDPVARLDAANQRLVTMNYAASNLQVAFNDFYGSLNQDQRTKLDSLVRK